MTKMTIRKLIEMLEALETAHGGDAKVDFQHKWASGRTALGSITSYTTMGLGVGNRPATVRFTLDYARGKLDVGEEDTVDQGVVG